MNFEDVPVYKGITLEELKSTRKVLNQMYSDQQRQLEVTFGEKRVQREIYVYTLKWQVDSIDKVIEEITGLQDFYKIVGPEFLKDAEDDECSEN